MRIRKSKRNLIARKIMKLARMMTTPKLSPRIKKIVNPDIHEDIEIIKPPKMNMEIVTFTNKKTKKPMAVAFEGRRNQPIWEETFSTKGQRKKHIEDTVDFRKEQLQNRKNNK